MIEAADSVQKSTGYAVWDRTTRIFHWTNVVCVFLLMAIGTVILNVKTLGIGNEGKVLLKIVHVLIGYVFFFNLAWRIIWGFIGNHYARWKNIFSFNRLFFQELKDYLLKFRSGNAAPYLGHNPAARLMVMVLFILLSSQAITGLVVAGTDIYYPPFGHIFKQQVIGDRAGQITPDDVVPGRTNNLDQAAYKEMRNFRKPFITIHYYGFFCLLGLVLIHILGVIVTEVRERNAIISAMFSGVKYFKTPPVDITKED